MASSRWHAAMAAATLELFRCALRWGSGVAIQFDKKVNRRQPWHSWSVTFVGIPRDGRLRCSGACMDASSEGTSLKLGEDSFPKGPCGPWLATGYMGGSCGFGNRGLDNVLGAGKCC